MAEPVAQDSDDEEKKEPAAPTPQYPILQNWKTILISCAASMFEFYDFGVLGFYSYEIGLALFPPNLTEMQYTFWIYALFWCGFVTRPFGGALFGYISDHSGRKIAFRLSIICMALCTFAIGCVPNYATIGVAAPIILLLLRLIQGLSTGGETSSVYVYLYEIAPKHRRALWMSLVVISSVGSFLATLVKIGINHIFSDEAIFAWAWRIPFWFGILLIFIGFWSKFALKPSPVFLQMVNANADDHNVRTKSWFSLSGFVRHQHEDEQLYNVPTNPFVIACCYDRYHLLVSITLVFATALNHAQPYMLNVYLPDYLDSATLHGWSDPKAYQFNIYNLLLMYSLTIAAGYYTDKYGPMKPLIISGVVTLVLSPFAWYAFTLTSYPWQDFLLMALCSLPVAPTLGACYFWYVDVLLLDPRTRTRLFGVAYNIGAIAFAGTAPLFGICFLQVAGHQMGMLLTGCWMSLLAVFSLVSYLYGQYGLTKQYEKQKEPYDMEQVFKEEQQELTAENHDQ